MENEVKAKIGRYKCRVKFTIVGLTNRTKEDFNKLLAKEGKR